MQDAWRAYLELALGVTQASRRKAEQAVRELLTRGGATAAQLQGVVDELLRTSRSNRAELVKLVRYEVDRALGKVGLATTEEVEALAARVRELERQLRERPEPAEAPPAEPPAAGQTATKKVAKKVAAKKAPSGAAAKTTTKAVKKAPKKTVTRAGGTARKAAPPAGSAGDRTDE